MAAAVNIRPAEAGDRPYLLDSFWRALRSSSAYADHAPPKVLISLMEPLLVLWSTAVAEVEGVIVGWLCWRDSTTVGWLSVREDLRHRGIARALLKHAGIGKGRLFCAFLPTRGFFADKASTAGYDVKFRPYLPLEAQAALEGMASGE